MNSIATILKFPPAIKHVGQRPSQDKQSLIVDQALANLRIPKAASKLMKFYAAHATGFRPSLKMVDEATGIGVKNVSTVRSMLMRYGLIDYDGDNITIDWLRLCAFASLDPYKMGKKKSWNISPLCSNALDDSKTQVHNYIGTRDSELMRLYYAYKATAEALLNGVKFPELEGKTIPEINPDCTCELKTQVHNYIGNEISCGWYNPFNEPDPLWVYQDAIIDAYGEIVGYTHYNTVLPF